MTQIAQCEATRSTTSMYARWLRVMAVVYDPFVWMAELGGMRRRRCALLADAHGRVVEIGAGTGLNIRHYPDTVDDLLLTEPEPGMRRKLTRRLARRGRVAVISDAPAEQLPVPDASVDTVVATLVLCTVGDPERALREIARVLRPGGQLLFIEHVRSDWRFLAMWQDILLRPWRGFAGGCVCNRPTLELLRASGFTVDAKAAVWSGMPAIVLPLAVGRAQPAQTSST